MKKLLLLIFLCFSVNAFSASWKKVSENDKGDSFYIDINNIKKIENFIFYWELIDLKEPIYGALSTIRNFKANCSKETQAMLSTSSYTGQMGKYILINEAKYNGTKFLNASKSTVMKFACGNLN
tara:strand:+ start:330 stop:701 length:372 start_codon:yes stop_codon:yes gene_type:complete